MERYDEHRNRPNGSKKLAIGLVILFLGAILLADNFRMLPWGFKSIIFTWQMLLIAIGFINLFSRNNYATGVILILIGAFFLIPDIVTFPFNFTRLFWPVLLIAVGLLIISRRNITRNHHFNHRHNHRHFDYQNQPFSNSSDDYMDEVNIFGGSKKSFLSENFKGGKIVSIFGGSEIDLSHAKLAEGTNMLEMICIFGGSSIIIPSDWRVRSDVVSILGGFADKRSNISDASMKDRELIIKGVAIFGGGDIKSFKES